MLLLCIHYIILKHIVSSNCHILLSIHLIKSIRQYISSLWVINTTSQISIRLHWLLISSLLLRIHLSPINRSWFPHIIFWFNFLISSSHIFILNLHNLLLTFKVRFTIIITNLINITLHITCLIIISHCLIVINLTSH
jgi:hypothetical protein